MAKASKDGRKKFFSASLLNLLPGFGLGYVLIGKKRSFGYCIAGRVIAAIVGVFLATLVTNVLCEFFSCRTGARVIASAGIAAFVGFVAISVPSAIHLGVRGFQQRLLGDAPSLDD